MNADPLAASYRWLEYAAFGRALERCRFEFLQRAVAARRILILGEGDGRFLARLVECHPHAEIVIVDSSARMLDLARRRLPASAQARVEFQHLDARWRIFFSTASTVPVSPPLLPKFMLSLIPAHCGWWASFRRLRAGGAGSTRNCG